MNWYLAVLKNYAGFNGRSSQKEYWMFVFFNILFNIAAKILDALLGTTIGGEESIGIISLIYTLVVLIPGLAVLVRRLHDIGKSGWYFLLIFIPFAGFIWLLVLLCTGGDIGPNKYGEDPNSFDNLQTDFA